MNRLHRAAVAVEATAAPDSAEPRLADLIAYAAADGILPEHADWWYTHGLACSGHVTNDTGANPSEAQWAVAAVMHHRILIDQPLDNDPAHLEQVIVAAKLALAWDAGRRDTPLRVPEEGATS